MSGDTSNPRIWVDGTVLVAPVDTLAPTDVDTPFGAGWDDLGLLSEDGMTETHDQTVTEHYAWGGKLVRTTRSKFKRTAKIFALEDNVIVFDLVNPGSEGVTAGGVTTRTVLTPKPNKKAFAIETIDGDIIRRRIIPTGEVIDIAPIVASDATMEMKELTIYIYPDADGVLYHDITNDPQAVEGS